MVCERMGKRKSRAKPVESAKKKYWKQPVPTTFSCHFCNHEKCVTCKMDKAAKMGSLECGVCGETFRVEINSLAAPIDVYTDWIDACEQTKGIAPKPLAETDGGKAASRRARESTLEEAVRRADDLVDDERSDSGDEL